MTITRILIAAAVLAGTAVGMASPALAEPFLGVYRFDSTSDGTSRWTVTPCDPNSGCNALVGANDTSNELIDPFVGRAVRDDERWNMTVDLPDSIRCDLNQRTYPGRLEFSWDAETMSGTIVTLQTTPNCGRPAMAVTNSGTFTLTKVVS
jgi:hypothetical protein